MWDGVTYVEPSRRPVIHEGVSPASLVVMNAGPAPVDLHVWSERTSDPDREPTFKMTMPAGNTRAVNGPMVAVTISSAGHIPWPPGPPFAAVAWRVVR